MMQSLAKKNFDSRGTTEERRSKIELFKNALELAANNGSIFRSSQGFSLSDKQQKELDNYMQKAENSEYNRMNYNELVLFRNVLIQLIDGGATSQSSLIILSEDQQDSFERLSNFKWPLDKQKSLKPTRPNPEISKLISLGKNGIHIEYDSSKGMITLTDQQYDFVKKAIQEYFIKKSDIHETYINNLCKCYKRDSDIFDLFVLAGQLVTNHIAQYDKNKKSLKFENADEKIFESIDTANNFQTVEIPVKTLKTKYQAIYVNKA